MKLAVTTFAFCIAALLSLGLVMLYSASMRGGSSLLVSQLTWCALGGVACVAAARMDYRLLKRYHWFLYGAAVVLLLMVFLPVVGIHRNGASRWIGWMGKSFCQPSELAKIALIVALAWYAEHYQRFMHEWWRGLVLPGGLAGGLLGLIFIEPDRGTTILLAAVTGTMLLVAGARLRYIIPFAVAGIIGLTISIINDPMRLRRVMSWLDLEQTKETTGQQAYQAMLGLGAGGWTGLGLGNGRRKLGFIPENHTDFIFAIIGEELGLIAGLLVLLAFLILVVCGVFIASRARDKFGAMLGIGITFLIGFQAFINIGVVTSALPNKGLPLPFISYGGSNLFILLTCVGFMFSIARLARAVPVTMDLEDASANPFAKPQTA
jgi:cell division protein FtsW